MQINSKIKKRNLVLINNATYKRKTLSERPIRQPLSHNDYQASPFFSSTCSQHKVVFSTFSAFLQSFLVWSYDAGKSCTANISNFLFVVHHRVHEKGMNLGWCIKLGISETWFDSFWWGHYPTVITKQPIREIIAPAISLRVEHFSTLDIHRAMLFSIAEVVEIWLKLPSRPRWSRLRVEYTPGIKSGLSSWIT